MRFSSKVLKCEQSPVRKFNSCAALAQQRGRTIYHLNIGQPDVKTPPAFFEAVKAFSDPVLEYAPSPGLPGLIDAVRDYYADLGVTLRPEDILVTTGGGEALEIALACILDQGDELLVPEPFYSNYSSFAHLTGANIVPIPTEAETGYRYADRARIEPLITPRTRGILITNPGNPTGLVLSREEMRLMADIAREHELFLVSDEVYREYIYGGKVPSTMAELEDVSENVILIDSVSKRFSACGARVGMLICRNREFIAQALKLCQGRLCSATLDQLGAEALYRTATPEYYASVREEYQRRRDTVLDALSRIPGVTYDCPEGAFYIMATLPVDDTEALQYFLLEEFEDGGETVMYAPGAGFYATPGKGVSEIRIAYVRECAYLRRAIELLGLGIRAYNEQKG